MAKEIKLTEDYLHSVIKECVNEALKELDQSTYDNYWKGRVQQAKGQRPMSKANIRKGEKDLTKDKALGYPCGGAQNGEEYARIQADDKHTQNIKNYPFQKRQFGTKRDYR